MNLEGEIIEISPIKEFSKFGKTGRVAIAIIKNKEGKQKLTLWNDEIDLVKTGDKIRIINGYIKEWKGEKSINIGRYGKLEVIE